MLESSGDVTVERYDPAWKSMEAILDGTLLMDFYEDCVKTIVDFVREQFTVPEEEERKPLVGPDAGAAHDVPEPADPARQPDERPRGVPVATGGRDPARVLRGAAQAAAQPHVLRDVRRRAAVPRLPDQVPVHGPGGRDDLRQGLPHPDASCTPAGGWCTRSGAGTEIHVFDLERGEMVANVPVPRRRGRRAPGRRLLGRTATSCTRSRSSRTRTPCSARLRSPATGLKHEFRPVTVLCGTTLVTLGTIPKIRDRVFAIGRGKGLYSIDPANVPTEIQPLVAFNAVGSARVRRCAVAGVRDGRRARGGRPPPMTRCSASRCRAARRRRSR